MTGPSVTGTPLQAWSVALFALLEDARDELDDDTYQVFVDLICFRVAREAARIARREDEWAS